MLRMLTAAILSMFGLAAHAQSPDRPPTVPGNPTVTVHSPTFAVVQWQRSSDDRGAVVGYAVRRDGVDLGTFDALSYVDRDLLPGRGYNYVIRAVDNAGQRSPRATVRAVTPDAVPSPPSGIRADVYSRTAAELFWDRSAAFGERYEIKRDGVAVATTDGTSHHDNSLSSARPYLFEVIALNRENRRSAPVRLFVDTAERGAGPAPMAGPAAPTGLRTSVYSRTAAEVFWTRPTTFGMIYEVRRDGEVLTTTGGTSYRYEIVAIDREGKRSTASAITLATPGDEPFAEPDQDAANVVARLGYPAARELADELVSSAYLSLYHDIDDALVTFLTTQELTGDVSTAACPGGGTARGELGYYFVLDVELDDCTIEGRTLSGHLAREAETSVTGAGGGQTATVTFDALSVDAGPAGRLLVSGTSRRVDNSAADGAGCGQAPSVLQSIDNRIESARLESADGVTIVTDASWSQSVVTDPVLTGRPFVDPCLVRVATVSFEGEASVTSARFGADGATLEKRGDLVRDPREDGTSATSARLAADFGDGSTLAVTANPGTDGEAQVDIVAEGVAVSFTDDYRFEAREDFPRIND